MEETLETSNNSKVNCSNVQKTKTSKGCFPKVWRHGIEVVFSNKFPLTSSRTQEKEEENKIKMRKNMEDNEVAIMFIQD